MSTPSKDKKEKPPKEIKESPLKKIVPQLKEGISSIRSAIKETFFAVRSEDAPSRNASIWFIISLLLALGVVLKAVEVAYQNKKIKKIAAEKIALIQAEKQRKVDEEKLKLIPPPFVSLGGFSLELREKPGMFRPKNSLNSAEMEIVVTCEKADLCEWIGENIPLMRAELGALFVPTERERLLTVSGKRAFREEIREQLNRYLENREKEKSFEKRGRIIEVLLPRFIMS